MSLAENYIYSVIYQIISVIIPFITVPYISKILGAEGIGINAYTASIVAYFALFGTLGIGLYAGRSVAYVRDDRKRLSQIFWSIFLLQFTLCVVSFVLCIIFTTVFADKYRLIQIIQSLNLLAAAIDISWLFVGIEDLKKLVVRSILIRILGIFCIFAFVRDSGDLWVYTAISTFSLIFGQLVMWAYLYKVVDKYKVGYKDVIVHLRPSLELFLPQIAIQIYLVLNKTMLGALVSNQEVGFYESADKIVKMSLAFLTATSSVMLPRVANSFARGEKDKIRQYVYVILNFVTYLAIPMTFGLIGISGRFVPWFLGNEFLKTSTLIIILSPAVIFIAWSNVIGFQYMIPTGKTREFTISVVAGAAINFILNILLIRRMYSVGSAIATVAAEVAVTVIQFFLVRKDIKLMALYKNLIRYNLSGLVMFIAVILIGYPLDPSYKTTIVQVLCGAFIYIGMLFLLKSDINNYIFSRLYKRICSKFISKEAA
jgi:O-antigen/teichoic acid export membrane protein